MARCGVGFNLAAGATDEESACLTGALSGRHLYISDPETPKRQRPDFWSATRSESVRPAGPEDRLLLCRAQMIDPFLAGGLPDLRGDLFVTE